MEQVVTINDSLKTFLDLWQLQPQEVEQLKYCILNYAKTFTSEGFFSFRITNVFKSLLGSSDWQESKHLLTKNLIEKANKNWKEVQNLKNSEVYGLLIHDRSDNLAEIVLNYCVATVYENQQTLFNQQLFDNFMSRFYQSIQKENLEKALKESTSIGRG